jgi:hypothetical protein
MPARTYQVALRNAVSPKIQLKLVDANLEQGNWIEGWTPPSTIYKNSNPPGVGQWQSESTTFPLHGTEGHVVYEIEDGNVNFVDSQNKVFPGINNQFTIHWSNPAFGSPGDPDSHFKRDDIYNLDVIWRSSGSENELPDFQFADWPSKSV